MEAGAFVLSACGYMTSGDLPANFPLRDHVNLGYAHGGSQIVAPLGIPLVPPTSGDTIIYADCQADMIKVWKAIIDTVEHYARPDIVRLQYMKSEDAALADRAADALHRMSGKELARAAEHHDLRKEELAVAMENVAKPG